MGECRPCWPGLHWAMFCDERKWRESHLDDEQPVWVIPRAKMKVATRDLDHRVPLCPEIVAELRHWQGVFGRKGYLFPSPTGGEHIGRESIEKVYGVTLGLGRKHSPHGWRSAFSTLARDKGSARDVVELALDRAHVSEVARAHDRGERFTRLVECVQLVVQSACCRAARGGGPVHLKNLLRLRSGYCFLPRCAASV